MGVFQNNLMGAAAAAASAGGGDFYSHQIANSCRFNNNYPAVENLSRTQGTPTDVDKCTISVWLKRSKTGAAQYAFTGSGKSGAGYSQLNFGGDGPTADEFYYLQNPGSVNIRLESTAVYRDTSAWMNIVIAQDSTQSTAADRNKIYFNGVQYTAWGDYSTYSTLNSDFLMNTSGNTIFVGSAGGGDGAAGLGFDGYIAEYVFIDGTQNAVTDFGESKNGVWIPKDPSGLTFGDNGCYLKFESSSDLGNDSSGNNNDFTVHANVTASDQMLDSPTFSDSNGGNYCTINPLNTGSNNTLSEGNLKVVSSSGGCTALGTMNLITGYKWYFEARCTGSGNNWVGIIEENDYTNSANTNSSIAGSASFNTYLYGHNGLIYYGSSSAATGATFTTNDVMGVLVDLESATNTIQFYKGGAAQGSAFSLTGTGINYTAMSDRGSGSGNGFIYNFGQDSTFAGAETAATNTDSSGRGEFLYDDSTGGLAICSANLPLADAINPAETDDDYPQELFFMSQYAGNGSGRTITTENQTDLMFIRNITDPQNWYVLDSTRVITDNKYVLTNDDAAEATLPQSNITSVGATSVGISSGTWLNSVGSTYQMWMWRANGGTTASNSNGSITSTVQVDPSSGFSIVSYTGADSTWDNMSTVGHGLSSAPDCILLKPLTHLPWEVFFSDLGGTGGGSTAAGNSLVLNSTAALYTNQTYRTWGDVMPTSTVFTVNGNNANAASVAMIAYCFANTEGYIKSGSYEGNGNADGSFVYCGFRPALIITKSLDSTSDWQLFDDKRLGYNVDNNEMQLNEQDAQVTTDMIDILSNGFKFRIATDPNVAETYVYLALAFNPFQYATAR